METNLLNIQNNYCNPHYCISLVRMRQALINSKLVIIPEFMGFLLHILHVSIATYQIVHDLVIDRQMPAYICKVCHQKEIIVAMSLSNMGKDQSMNRLQFMLWLHTLRKQVDFSVH